MVRAFTKLAFSRAVKAAQSHYGAREHGERLEHKEPARERLNDDLAAFIAAADSFSLLRPAGTAGLICSIAAGRRGF